MNVDELFNETKEENILVKAKQKKKTTIRIVIGILIVTIMLLNITLNLFK